MKVWINQDLCTGDAQCAEICPSVFFMHDDGRTNCAHVRNAGESGYGPDEEPMLSMGDGVADVPPPLADAVSEAAEYCPGECIFVERG